ncbi:TauD/TfdA family dioxygenase [Chryseobacterium indologenes]|uniref:TauD/TfdA family dioxygenase n=1 Tax=Chryseobacterium TaxID=59732 RepID=UPI0016299839|nr:MULTISPECIES: TauD/TfdA family dioxygenase [Chryseobacterium]MDM1553023.1 TauD/TfdA family dioxygenase [Chryseobacterium indologenes]WET49149.1 TauD/TfdA family dioxygenase [Chryseobacterium indologenes]
MIKYNILDEKEHFFAVIEEKWNDMDDFTSWFRTHKSEIDTLLSEAGVVLFKRTGITDDFVFQKFLTETDFNPINYLDGNSPRTKKKSQIYTSTDYPPEAFISMHNELSYSNFFPQKIFFLCVTPSSEGGETPVLNGASFIDKLDPEIMGDFLDKKIKYIRNLHGGNGMGTSWQDTFETEDKAFVENFCSEYKINFFWGKNNSLKLEQIRPTVQLHPQSGKRVWFNQADQFHPSNNAPEVYEAIKLLYKKENYPLNVCYEDDTDIPLSIFDHVRDLAKENLIATPWSKEDLMLVDNLSALHGRNPFAGKREILVAMA